MVDKKEQLPASLRLQRTMTNLLMNYIDLVAGVPTRMHFTDWYFMVRVIADKESGKTKPIKSVTFWCDELKGEDVARTFTVLSKKLIAHLIPFLPNKEYILYDFIITKMGSGFFTDWNIQPIRRPEEIPMEERRESFDAQKLIEKLWNAI